MEAVCTRFLDLDISSSPEPAPVTGQLLTSHIVANPSIDVPINRVPTEILEVIFSECLTSQESNAGCLRTLTMVCTLWRDIIHNYPALHTVFALTDPSFTPSHLQRSRGLPIDVLIDQRGRSIYEVAGNMQLLEPHLDRLRSLTYIASRLCVASRVLVPLMEFPDNILTALSITATMSNPDEPLSTFVFGLPSLYAKVFCQLTTLSLQDVAVHILPSWARAHTELPLQRLELGFSYKAPPNTGVLVLLLSCFPDLEAFTFRTRLPIAHKEFKPSAFQPRPHPRLRTITFEGVDVASLSYVVANILPRAEELFVSLGNTVEVPRAKEHWAAFLRPMSALTRLTVQSTPSFDIKDLFAAMQPNTEDPATLMCPTLAHIDILDAIWGPSVTHQLSFLDQMRRKLGAAGLHVVLDGAPRWIEEDGRVLKFRGVPVPIVVDRSART